MENSEKKSRINYMPFFIVGIIALIVVCGYIIASVAGFFGEKAYYGSQKVTVTPKENFTYEIKDEGVCIVSFNGEANTVAIPKEIDGVQVVEILAEAFMENSSLHEVFIPEGVQILGNKAFYYCTNLQYVYIPSSVYKIGTNTFTKNGDKLVVSGNKDSFAEDFCKTHNIQFEVDK